MMSLPAPFLKHALSQPTSATCSMVLNHRSFCYKRTELVLPPLPLFSWLEQQPLFPKIYWEEGGVATAAIGAACRTKTLPQVTADLPFRFFGGFDFAKRRSTTWDGFPQACYILPRIEITQTQDQTLLALHWLDDQQECLPLSFDIKPHSTLSMTPTARVDCPTRVEWKKTVAAQLAAIEKNRLQKIVLARHTRFHFASPFSPYALLSNLSAEVIFSFAFSPHMTLIGATPERLYTRTNKALTSYALAGTRPLGATAAETARLKRALLHHPKEQREFLLVDDFIAHTLAPLSHALHRTKQAVIETASTQHLTTTFHATLYPEVSDADLLKALHPTPALGGFPRKEALRTLETIEPFDRGWYGAPVGWIANDSASFAVAIRSALAFPCALHLFIGAGIVPGSLASCEWDELEHKMKPYLVWEKPPC